jgi:hypothetical protein
MPLNVTSAVLGDVVKLTVPVVNVFAPTLALDVNTARPRDPMTPPTTAIPTATMSMRFNILDPRPD